jgi:hypothetical protein
VTAIQFFFVVFANIHAENQREFGVTTLLFKPNHKKIELAHPPKFFSAVFHSSWPNAKVYIDREESVSNTLNILPMQII